MAPNLLTKTTPKIYEVWRAFGALFGVIFMLLAKRAQDGSQRAFTWLKKAPGALQEGSTRAKMAPRGPKMAPRGPKMAPRGPLRGPRGLQEGPKTAKMAPRRPIMAPRWPLKGPKKGPDSPRWPRKGPKMARSGFDKAKHAHTRAATAAQSSPQQPKAG